MESIWRLLVSQIVLLFVSLSLFFCRLSVLSCPMTSFDAIRTHPNNLHLHHHQHQHQHRHPQCFTQKNASQTLNFNPCFLLERKQTLSNYHKNPTTESQAGIQTQIHPSTESKIPRYTSHIVPRLLRKHQEVQLYRSDKPPRMMVG